MTYIKSALGVTDKSAYQIAVDNGFVGTEQEWLDSLYGGGNIDCGSPDTLIEDIILMDFGEI